MSRRLRITADTVRTWLRRFIERGLDPAGVRARAAPLADVQAVDRPAVHRQGP
nr:hypothetical protein [Streptomyces sulfonofaciens]